MTTLSAETNAIVKLDLGDKGGTRRIPFSKLWDSESSQVSYSCLCNLALRHSTLARPNLNRAIITYTDVDGDTITISTQHELQEAFEQFMTPLSTMDVTQLSLRAQVSFTRKQKFGPKREMEKRMDDNLRAYSKVNTELAKRGRKGTKSVQLQLALDKHVKKTTENLENLSIDLEDVRPRKITKMAATKETDKLESPNVTNQRFGKGNESVCTSNLVNLVSGSDASVSGNAVPGLDAPKRKVQVFIMMGQSNMLGLGKFGPVDAEKTLKNSVIRQSKYPYLWNNSTKDWAVSNTVRNVFVMGSADSNSKRQNNSWMAGNQGHQGNHLGPELGIGHHLETHYGSTPVMMLKSCIGNRALGWDLLPPGTPSFDWTEPKTGKEYTYAGYGQSPERWLKGTTPQPINWKAGVQYDGDTRRADEVLADLGTFYPDATEYEVAGFLWWQGDRDSRSPAHSEAYESNLVALIKALRVRYDAPNAPFVTASLGQSTLDPSCKGNCGGLILQAMLNVADATKYPEFAGNVDIVDAHDYALPGESSGSHYSGNADTYMQVGQAMGEKMVQLLKN